MGKFVDLSKAQKDEIRRLTQLANRRIKAATKSYEKAGKMVVPKEIVGDIQVRQKWATEKSPLSRSVKFESMKDYRRHLNFLRSFEVTRPGIKEYTSIQRMKTLQAITTATGLEPSPKLIGKLSKMDIHQLTDFWKEFEKKATRTGVTYASDSNMMDTLETFFGEDLENLLVD